MPPKPPSPYGGGLLLPDARFRSPTAVGVQDMTTALRRVSILPGRNIALPADVDRSIKAIAIVPDSTYQAPGWHQTYIPYARQSRGILKLIVEGRPKSTQEFDILALMDRWDGDTNAADGADGGKIVDMAEQISMKLQRFGSDEAGAVAGALVDFVQAAGRRGMKRGIKLATAIVQGRSDVLFSESPVKLELDLVCVERRDVR